MLFSLRYLRRSLFGISLEETTFAKRGFYRGNEQTQEKLELIGRTFIQGYHAALEDDHFAELVPRLQAVDAALRGFAFEGAAMGLSLLDYFSPRKRRLVAFMLGANPERQRRETSTGGRLLGANPDRQRRSPG